MFELFLERAQEVLGVPAVLISHCPFLPEYVKDALISSVNFIPWLYFLYYAIELLERFFLKRIGLFIKLMKRLDHYLVRQFLIFLSVDILLLQVFSIQEK